MDWHSIHDELFLKMNELFREGTNAESVQEKERIIADCCKKHNLTITPLDRYGCGILLHQKNKRGGIMSFVVHDNPTETHIEFFVFSFLFSKKLLKIVMAMRHYKIIDGMLFVDHNKGK